MAGAALCVEAAPRRGWGQRGMPVGPGCLTRVTSKTAHVPSASLDWGYGVFSKQIFDVLLPGAGTKSSLPFPWVFLSS